MSKTIRNQKEQLPYEDLRSDLFDIVQFFEGHEASKRFVNFDNSATIELAKSLPLGLRGDAHREMRAVLAKALVEGKRRLLPKLPDLIEKHFSKLKQVGVHDLLGLTCKPFVRDCMTLLAGVDLTGDQSEHLSDIFDPGASTKRRRKLDETARALLENDTNGQLKVSLAISAMGRDPLLGTLVGSLHHHFISVVGQPMNALRFDPVPTNTAVPYVWRERSAGSKDTKQILECRLDQFVGQEANERMKFFGAGRHTCLGKPHTLIIFEMLSDYLEGCDTIVQRSDVNLVNHHVMRLPAQFLVDLG